MNCKQVIIVRKDLNMRKGKIAAQASHASMMFLLKGEKVSGFSGKTNGVLVCPLTEEQNAWLSDPESAFAKIVVSVDSEQELRDIMKLARDKGLTVNEVIDAGRTEFNGVPTLTVAAIGPHEASKFVGVTDQLKLM